MYNNKVMQNDTEFVNIYYFIVTLETLHNSYIRIYFRYTTEVCDDFKFNENKSKLV